MANTTNFGWETPDDTDLVSQGAAAMRTLGNSIDASFVDLKGGTTGQILTKNSNTDLDFVWSSESGDISSVTAGTGLTGGGTSGAVTLSLDSPVAATLGGTAQTTYTTGDLLYASASNTLTKRAIGTTGQVLTVSGGVPTWAAAATGGGLTLLSTTTLSSNSTTISSISGSYKWLWIVLKGVFLAVDGEEVRMRMNGDTSASAYISTGIQNSNTTVTGVSVRSSYIPIVKAPDQTYTAYQYANAEILVPRYTDTDAVWSYINGHGYNGSGATTIMFKGSGVYDCSAAISSVTFYTSGASNFDGGTVYIYGVS